MKGVKLGRPEKKRLLGRSCEGWLVVPQSSLQPGGFKLELKVSGCVEFLPFLQIKGIFLFLIVSLPRLHRGRRFNTIIWPRK